jgi:WD40 repeat protein
MSATEESMIDTTGWADGGSEIGLAHDRADVLAKETSRRSWISRVALAALGLMPQGVRSRAQSTAGARRLAPGGSPLVADAKPALPPRALLRIGTIDLRTRGFIGAIAFSPDGRTIAAAVWFPGCCVAICDTKTGQNVGQLAAKGNRCVDSLAYSPDGTKLVAGTSEGDVLLWELSTSRLLFCEKLHGGAVGYVAFSPDGSQIASAGGDVIRLRRTVKPDEFLRDFTTRPGPVPAELAAAPVPGGEGSLGCVAFTPDGTRLVGGSMKEATLFIWRIADGQLLRTIPNVHGKPLKDRPFGWGNPSLQSVAITPDGRRIMSVGQTELKREETKLPGRGLNAPMREVRFWDIETSERVADYHGDEDTGWGHAALSPDGRRAAVVDFCRLCILETATGKAERTIALPGAYMWRPAFSPDWSLVVTPIHNTIGIFELATGRRLHYDERMPVSEAVSAAWSPSGDRIATGHFDGFVRVWDGATGGLVWHKLLAPIVGRHNGSFSARTSFLSFSRDGKTLIVGGDRDEVATERSALIAFYEATSGRLHREISQSGAFAAALAPDERMLVATAQSAHNTMRFVGIEVQTGKNRWANPPEDQRGFARVKAMHFERKPPWCIAALEDGTVIRFNALTGREQRRFVGEWRTQEQQKARQPREPYMMNATISVDGGTVVSSHMEWIYVWDAESGALRHKFPSARRCACTLALAPDGRTLATSDVHYAGDDTIRLYDIETGEQILALEHGDGRALVLAFSPDSDRLFAGFDLGTGFVWDVRRK